MPTKGADLIVRIITDASKAAQGVDEAVAGYSKFEQSISNLAGPASLVLGGVLALGTVSFNAAAKASTEAAAAQDEMKKAIGELAVAIGTALLPMMLPLVEALTAMAKWIAENMRWIGPLIMALGAFAAAILAINAGMAIARTVTAAWSAVTKIATAVQLAMNAAWLASPITWVILLIVALVAAFIYLWNNCEAFRQFWIDLWENLKAVVAGVVDWFTAAWETVVEWFSGAWADAIEKVNGLLERLREIGVAVLNALLRPINAIVDAFQRVVGAIQNVISWIRQIQMPDLSALNPFSRSAPVPATFGVAPMTTATAATPNRNRLAVPPASRGAASGGTVINITVNGALDAQSVSRQIARMLRVREGRVGLTVAAGVRA